MNDMIFEEIESLQEFLDSYSAIQIEDSEPPTLMEIAKFPHWENVYSNILAFFLDSTQVHEFGQLFIRSLIAIYSRYCPEGWPGKQLESNSVSETEMVEREFGTSLGKRIDIFVECSGFRVCIENKIWSGLHNNLCHYRDYCEEVSDGSPVLGIVLSPHRLESEDEKKKLEEARFISVTYSDLVDHVQSSMGSYINSRNIRYQYLLFDFLEQSDKFRSSGVVTKEQQRLLNFWRDNEKKISNIQSLCDRLVSELNAKAKADAHSEDCMDRLSTEAREMFITRTVIRKISVFDLKDGGTIDGCGVFLDVWIEPLRITHLLGSRRGRDVLCLQESVNDLTNEAIRFEWDRERECLIFKNEGSPFDESVRERAVEFSVNILEALAKVRRATENKAKS